MLFKIFFALYFPICLLTTVNGQNPLLIPPLVNGPEYFLTAQNGSVEFTPGISTPTYGINGNILGPTLIAERGDLVTVHVTNALTGTGNTTTMHWHGFHLPASADGGPHQIIEQGATWSPSFEIMNDASTLWYHPHGEGKTDLQVARGLAGFFIVRDDTETALELPRTYGVDDLPLVLQTKAFDVLNQIAIATEMDTLPMVNATVDAYVDLPAQVVRLRLLNGASMRTFHVGFDNDQIIYVIAGDGGLLSAPVPVSRLIIAPGQRYEILVDLTGMESQSINMMSFASELPAGIYGALNPSGMGMGTIMGYNENPLNGADFELMTIQIIEPTDDAITAIPSELIEPASPPVHDMVRTFNLEPETMGMDNMLMGPFVINGSAFDMEVINEVIPINTVEKWHIINNTGIAHPFHIHEGQFYIDNVNGSLPQSIDAGMKDVVFIPSGQYVEVIKTFTDFADDMVPYMYHCHMLHHEDDGMMGSFSVVDPDAIYSIDEPDFNIFPNPVISGNSIYIESEETIKGLTVSNVIGNLVWASDYVGNTKRTIDLPQWACGIYFISIQFENYLLTKQLIVM